MFLELSSLLRIENIFEDSINIMICDDERIIASSIDKLILKAYKKLPNIISNNVITKNGLECIYRLYTDFLKGIKYNLILIDENMPFLTGSDAIKVIAKMISSKQLNKSLYFIKLKNILSLFKYYIF